MNKILNMLLPLVAVWAVMATPGCKTELAPKNPLLVALPPTPTPVVGPITFEDFESPGLANATTYGDAGATVTHSVSSADANTGAQSAQLTVTSAGWGAGFTIESNYGTFNVTGKTQFSVWINSDQTGDFTLRWREGTNESDVTNENWVSATQTVTGGAGWTQFQIPLVGFTEDAYGNPPCAGTCNTGSNGNNAQDHDNIGMFQIQFAAGFSGATIYIDDIQFLD